MTPLETPNVQGPTMEFAAEVRRGWESGAEDFGHIFGRRRLWMPSKVILEDGHIRVQTSERTEIFRPRRITWKGPDTFLVSGLDEKYHLKRILLRFKKPEEAQQVVSELKVLGSTVPPESISSGVESIPVQAVFLSRTTQLFTVVWRAFILAVLIAMLGLFAGAGGDPFILIILAIILAYVSFGLIFDLKDMRRKTDGWLKLERNSLSLISTMGENYVNAKEVKQLSPTMLVLNGGGSRLELTFSTVGHLNEALRMIRTSAPHVREQLIASPPQP